MPWYVQTNGIWTEVKDPQVRTNVAWNPVEEGWVRQSGIWQRFYYRDLTQPSAPTLTISHSDTSFTVMVADPTPSSTVSSVSLTGTRTNLPTTNFSETDLPFVAGDQSYVYEWAQTPAAGASYTFTATFKTATGVVSPTTTTNYTVPTVVTSYQAYIDPVGSGSWKNTEGWLTGDQKNVVIQGGINNLHRGCWFYGDRTDRFWGKNVTKMQIQVARLNTTHGIAGLANVRLSHHDNKTQPVGAPNMNGDEKIGELRRGEKKWFNVPSSWLTSIKNKNANYRGLGLYTTDLGESSPNYIRTYGADTDTGNGRIYVEWTD